MLATRRRDESEPEEERIKNTHTHTHQNVPMRLPDGSAEYKYGRRSSAMLLRVWMRCFLQLLLGSMRFFFNNGRSSPDVCPIIMPFRVWLLSLQRFGPGKLCTVKPITTTEVVVVLRCPGRLPSPSHIHWIVSLDRGWIMMMRPTKIVCAFGETCQSLGSNCARGRKLKIDIIVNVLIFKAHAFSFIDW